ncbi:Glycoside hydrolase family 28 [Arabidopsis thaliana x Arabidopsis arenosa]|uniref:Glycoside hydrolase family 28 n=1 Tax=Arabidopsis thaliana x Arabidopsis arenosa TaxID=1240361 RepID=A0A8T1Z4G9_9BRAS|nr:Glycoside hydrolase family 28 [Arabidopsis thaliana x Arabidopsis arenosa]
MLKLSRDPILCTTTLILITFSFFSYETEARLHHYTDKDNPNLKPEPPSQPPSPSPKPNDPSSKSPSPPQDLDHEVVYNVKKYGAVGDGVTDDTESFKTAWDSACGNYENNTASVLLVPYGFTFMIRSTIFTGPCRSYQYFQLDGTIVPRDGPKSWPSSLNKRQWLVFYRINGMALKGAGVIDGRGQNWWDLPCKPHRNVNKTKLAGPCESPAALRFFMSSNVTVKGLSIKNSPQVHLKLDGCLVVHINSIRVISPSSSPNTDGIHIENSKSVEIYNSVISNGDDCVSIGPGSYDIDIRNLTCGPGGHGISIGSLGEKSSHACVSNVTVRDSFVKFSENGVRIKTWQGGSGSVSGVTFDNIHVDTVRNPIIIDQYYCTAKSCANKTSAVFVNDIVYQSIKGTYDIRSPPMHFGCSNNVPCTNLTLSDIELLPSKKDIVVDPFCWNAYGITDEFSVPLISCLKSNPSTSLLSGLSGRCGSP